MGEFAPVLQAYTEVGILGLLAVLVIILIWRSFDRKGKDDKWKTNKIDKQDENIDKNAELISEQLINLTNLIKKQNENYQEFQQDMMNKSQSMNEQLIEQIIDGVYYRVPSNVENHKLTKINNEIDVILQDILIETNASRVSLVQYHNGGKGINKQAFLKMSMTNERIQLNVKPSISEFKDQFRSVLGYFVNEIGVKGHCYIKDVDEMLEKDIGMYEFMCNRGVESKFGCAIHNNDKCVIAFICAEFIDKKDADEAKIDTSFKEHYREIERLLNS